MRCRLMGSIIDVTARIFFAKAHMVTDQTMRVAKLSVAVVGEYGRVQCMINTWFRNLR